MQESIITRPVAFEPKRGVSEIGYSRELVHFEIPLVDDQASQRLKIYEKIAQAGISISFIKIYAQGLSFIVAQEHSRKIQEIIEFLGLKPGFQTHCAIISVIASNMRSIPGVMAKIMAALTAVEVPILQIGDSHNSVSCLIAEHNLARALPALKEEFKITTRAVQLNFMEMS